MENVHFSATDARYEIANSLLTFQQLLKRFF